VDSPLEEDGFELVVPDSGKRFFYIASEPQTGREPQPPVTHTDALFADQSQSILDNLVVLLGQSSAWNCSDPERSDLQYEKVR
jgi:hypothetical protein